MDSRAIHEIKSDGHRLVTVKILSAIEAGDWRAVHTLAGELREIAERGLYHASQDKVRQIAAFAMGCHREPEPR